MKVYTVGLVSADTIFTPDMCQNPLPMLAAVVGVLAESESSPMVPDHDKQEVSEAI